MSEVSVEVPSTEVESVVKEMVEPVKEPVKEPVVEPEIIKQLDELVTVKDNVVYMNTVPNDAEIRRQVQRGYSRFR
jgi:hypothetical protein